MGRLTLGIDMDEEDVKIFCEMGFKYYSYAGKNRRPSPKEIGRQLGLDEKTVRKRVRSMEKEGFIQFYRAIPNPSLFDLPLLCTCGFRAQDILAKQQIVQKLLRAPYILEVGDFMGETIGVSLAALSEEDAQWKIKDLSSLAGVPSTPSFPPRRFPSPSVTPNRIDWELIRALRYDAIKPTNEIAAELGLTYRTAEYRISRLLDSQAFFVRAFVNASDSKGILFYSLFLELDEKVHERVKHELLDKHRGRLWFEFSPPVPLIILNMFATSVGEAEDNLLDALSHPGVRGGSLTLIKGMVEPVRPSWIDRLVEQRISTP